MKKIQCKNCSTCPIRRECDELEYWLENEHSLDGNHIALMEIYAKGKADGRKEAIDEFYDALAAELTWRLNTGDLFIVKRVAKAVQEKLKEREDGN